MNTQSTDLALQYVVELATVAPGLMDKVHQVDLRSTVSNTTSRNQSTDELLPESVRRAQSQ